MNTQQQAATVVFCLISFSALDCNIIAFSIIAASLCYKVVKGSVFTQSFQS